MKRILVFHRNCLFRDCLAKYLESIGTFEVNALPHEHAEHPAELISSGTDVILLDVNLPDRIALRLLEKIRPAYPHIKVVLLVPDDHHSLLECLAAGIHGCVLERSSLEELHRAITDVVSGKSVCCSDFAQLLFSEVTRFGQVFSWKIPAASETCRLTSRELEVLELIAMRKRNKEIAKELSVSLFTVKNHVHNILEKLHVGSRVEAVEAALHENLLSRR